MKRILFVVIALVLLLPAARQLEARVDVSIDFFYDNLGAGGNWVEVADYGFCWQPTIAVSNRSWRPYSDGYWAYTDVGWTWVSYEDFGWATYHYGRWIRLRGRGWVWVPGREWGPAWVSWRTGGDYVGWAPLPPRRAGEYWDESPITARVDIDFDIGPAYYNFIDVRYIGEPVLRERIFAVDQNVTYITKTVNVTNITYSNSQVYNYGPDYKTLSRYSTRPIQRLTLQRDANADPLAAARSNSLMKVEGDKLVIAAPQQFQKPTKSIAPKVVKEKIAQTPVERGWEPVGDQKAQTELKEKMKKEDPKSVPPPTVQASEKPETAASPGATQTPAGSSPMASPSPATSVSPATSPEKDKGKDKKREEASPAPSASVAATPGVSPATTPEKPKDKKKDKVAPGATPGASLAPGATATPPPPEKPEKPKKDKVAPMSTPVASATPAKKPEKPKRNEKPPMNPPTTNPPATAEQNPPPPPKVKPEKKHDTMKPTPLEPAQPDNLGPDGKPRKGPAATEPPRPPTVTQPEAKPKKHDTITQERAAPPSAPAADAPANPPANPPESRGKDEGKKKDKGKNEPVTSPTP